MSDAPASALWTGSAIAAAVGGRLHGPDFIVHGVEIDSRNLQVGDLFVALTGERDGHDFAAAAFARGAGGALVSRPVDGPCVVVADTLDGLGRLGEAARRRAGACRRGAVTGSVGKTSVTQAVRRGLDMAGPAHGSVKSFNNHIGVPLTLARMPEETRRAVFEIGMNHAGEITPLTAMVRPHAVAITTVAAVHTENFADGEAGVARAKAEILLGLEPGGQAILDADGKWFDFLRTEARRLGARVRTFGTGASADARLLRFAPAPGGASVEAVIDGARIEFPIRQAAPHWGPMSLCALLMMRALDTPLDLGLQALETMEALPGRGAETLVRAAGGAFLLIDDAYNASPISVTAALKALGARPIAGRRVAVLTDMRELGPDSEARHAALAGVAVEAGIDQVHCAGGHMQALWRALPADRRGLWAADAETLAPELASRIGAGDVVLVKGSFDSRASHVVRTLAALDSAAARGA